MVNVPLFQAVAKICLFFTQNEHIPRSFTRGAQDVYSAPHSGSVAERLKAPVLKIDERVPEFRSLRFRQIKQRGWLNANPFVWAYRIV